MIPGLFLQGLILSALFSPLAVLVHGKMKRVPGETGTNNLVMPKAEWAWKIAILTLIYVIIYVSFGLLVFTPLAGDALEEYYKDFKIPSWILLLQAGRALVWIALALPVIRMMKGDWWEAGLAVSLLYSVLMGGLLLIPTSIMPDSIRIAHFFEVAFSNFLYGWVVVWLLHRHCFSSL
jgi:hypothetical protein